MKRLLLFVVACMFLRPAFAQSMEDGKLQEFFKNYLEHRFSQKPLDATGLGDHRFDALLDDISPTARESWRALAKETLAKLPKEVAYKKLSRDGQIDFEIFENELSSQLWGADNMRPFEKDARTYGAYLSDSVYMLLAQSTLPKETNVANAIARMAQMPRIIAEAERSLTHPAKPILEINPRHDLILALASENDPALREDAAHLLFDEARILDGELPADARAFSQRLARVMRRGLR